MSRGLTRRSLLKAAAASPFALQARAGCLSTTLLVSDPSGVGHDPGPGQPDQPGRLTAIAAALAEGDFRALARADAPAATRAEILRVHTAAHLERLEKSAPKQGFERLGSDLVMSPGSLEAARRAAGGAIFAVDAVMRGKATNAFVASRPPGHHARASEPMGFCLFNNAAIAARHALAAHGVERVAIVDFDVHHGNGVQDIFWAEKRVLYCSTHQSPLYPGTGAASERGEFDTIVNTPLAKGDDGAAFRAAFRARILPRLDAFAPDLIIVCAGFDAHLHDPLGGLRLLEEDFRDATLRIMEIAARRCHARVVSLLEGGYNPQDLAKCVAAHVGALMEA